MRTFTTCMQCQVENGIPNFASLGVQRIPDDGVIELTCDRGHHTFMLIQQAKFEILSELAVTAAAGFGRMVSSLCRLAAIALEHDRITSLLSFRIRSLRSRVSWRFPSILSRELSTVFRFKDDLFWCKEATT